MSAARARVQRPLVEADEQHPGVVVEHVLGAVAVVGVEVEDPHPLARVGQRGRDDGDVGHEAEPHRRRAGGVVAGRPHGAERGLGRRRASSASTAVRPAPAASRAASRRPPAHAGVGVDPAAALRGHLVDAVEVPAGWTRSSSSRVAGRGSSGDHRVVELRRRRRRRHRLQPRRALRVPRAGEVLEVRRVGREQHRHRGQRYVASPGSGEYRHGTVKVRPGSAERVEGAGPRRGAPTPASCSSRSSTRTSCPTRPRSADGSTTLDGTAVHTVRTGALFPPPPTASPRPASTSSTRSRCCASTSRRPATAAAPTPPTGASATSSRRRCAGTTTRPRPPSTGPRSATPWANDVDDLAEIRDATPDPSRHRPLRAHRTAAPPARSASPSPAPPPGRATCSASPSTRDHQREGHGRALTLESLAWMRRRGLRQRPRQHRRHQRGRAGAVPLGRVPAARRAPRRDAALGSMPVIAAAIAAAAALGGAAAWSRAPRRRPPRRPRRRGDDAGTAHSTTSASRVDRRRGRGRRVRRRRSRRRPRRRRADHRRRAAAPSTSTSTTARRRRRRPRPPSRPTAPRSPAGTVTVAVRSRIDDRDELAAARSDDRAT